MLENFKNCANCTIKNNEKECFVGQTGFTHFCEFLDPESPKYDPRYISNVQRRNGQLPSLMTQAVNLTKAVVRNTMTGGRQVDEETQNKRLEICRACPLYLSDSEKCGSCGCLLTGSLGKTIWAAEKCPENKWVANIEINTNVEIPKNEGCGCGQVRNPDR